MPSARMTKTVCVASNSPKPSQIDAIQRHWWDWDWCDCEWIGGASIGRSYAMVSWKGQKCSEAPEPCSNRPSAATSPEGYCSHVHQNKNLTAPCRRSNFPDVIPTNREGAKFGPGIHQRR